MFERQPRVSKINFFQFLKANKKEELFLYKCSQAAGSAGPSLRVSFRAQGILNSLAAGVRCSDSGAWALSPDCPGLPGFATHWLRRPGYVI